MERRKNYTYYLSGAPETAEVPPPNFVTGVGIIISNKLHSSILDIEPISDRLLRLSLRSIVPITIICTYAPTAQRTDTEKDKFYDQLYELSNKWMKKGPTLILGDFNARLQTRLEDEETAIGPYQFDQVNLTLHRQTPEVMDNRQRFMDYVSSLDLRVMNTWFQKTPQQLVTFREAGTKDEDLIIRGKYETLDYVITSQRWRNTIITH
eukprot:2438417-Prorocentrum_lima.AAC.1